MAGWLSFSILMLVVGLSIVPGPNVGVKKTPDLNSVSSPVSNSTGVVTFEELGLNQSTCWGVTISNQTRIAFSGNQSLAVIPLWLSDPLPVATPVPLQVRVTLNLSSVDSELGSNLSNVAFYSADCSPVPSWLESVITSPVLQAVYWLRLNSEIAPSHPCEIFAVVFHEGSRFFDGVQTGEAPALSAIYGADDNGAYVFNGYWNFKGAAPPSGWTLALPYVQNNGITFTMNKSAGGFAGPTTAYGPAMVDFAGEFVVPDVGTGLMAGVGFVPDTYIGVYSGLTTLGLNAQGHTNVTDYPENSSAVYSVGTDGIDSYVLRNYENQFVAPLSSAFGTEQIGLFTQTTSSDRVTLSYMAVRTILTGDAMVGVNQSSTLNVNSSSISFTLPVGEYSYSLFSNNTFSPSQRGGNVSVASGGELLVPTTWHPVQYGLVVCESGLPSNTAWTFTIASVDYNSDSACRTVLLINGTYLLTFSPAYQYVPTPASTPVTISGRAVSISIIFTQHSAPDYLPLASEWALGITFAVVLLGVVFTSLRKRRPT